MSETGKIPDEHAPLPSLPRHTTPTWEVELLISGVAVFAMLQLPGWLDDQYFALAPRLDTDWKSFAVNVYAYLKTVALILSMTFSLHLLLRAQWIALVGMFSVYPDGILWEWLRIGPLQRKAERARFGDRDVLIDRADNRATTVFAMGVTLASALLVLLLTFSIVFALAMLLTRGLGVPLNTGFAFMIGTIVLVAPNMLARWIDRRYAARLAEGGRVQRAITTIFAAYTRIGFLGRGSNPTLALLASHGGERRAVGTVGLLMMLAFGCVGLSYYAMHDADRFGSYALFPREAMGTHVIDAAHYADQRNPARDEAVPMLQSAVIVGPYARLVVPYDPVRDGAWLGAHCAGGDAVAAARALVLSACLKAQRAVALDGRHVSADYELGSDPVTDRPALVMMIDVRDLARGRHELSIDRAPSLRADRDADQDDAARFDRIAFWR